MALLAIVVAAASVYLVYVLEILKLRRLNAMRLRRQRPDATEREVDAGRRAPARDRRVRGDQDYVDRAHSLQP